MSWLFSWDSNRRYCAEMTQKPCRFPYKYNFWMFWIMRYFLHKCCSKKRRFKWQLNCHVIPKVQLTVSKEIGNLTLAPAVNIKYIRGNEKVPIWSYLNWLERCERNIRPHYDAFILIWNTNIVESDFFSQLLLWHRKLFQMGSLTKALEYFVHKLSLKREFNKVWKEASE